VTAQESLCARCAKQSKTCCQRSEIHVTPGDVQRIRMNTGTIGFYEYARAINPEYLDQSDDPIWQAHVIRPDGSRRVLKRLPSGDCIYLTPSGCALEMEVRPLVCRIYPFSYNADGFYDDLEEGCPISLLTPGQSLIETLGMSLPDAKRWHRILYEEILQDHDENWPDLRLAV